MTVCSTRARQVFETGAKDFTDAEKSYVADYLTHSTATAEKYYRMKHGGTLAKGLAIIQQLGSGSR